MVWKVVTGGSLSWAVRKIGSHEDAFQEGCIALLDAIKNFEPQGAKFLTYAINCVYRRLQRVANGSDLIRLPASPDTIAAKQKIKPRSIEDEKWDLLVHQAKMAMGIGSLDIGNSCNKEHIEPEDRSKPRDFDEFEPLYKNLDKLRERDRRILSDKFGLSGSGEMTLEEVGRTMGICRERARQLEDKALDQLREFMRPTSLRPDYIPRYRPARKKKPLRNLLTNENGHEKKDEPGSQSESIPAQEDQHCRDLTTTEASLAIAIP